MTGTLEVAVLGDTHGHFDAELDGAILSRAAVRLCTGDLTPNRGRDRFDTALTTARGLAACGVHVILGNHDGPTGFTGRSFPRSYRLLEEALGPWHVGARRVEFPEHDLTLVGGRPLSTGGPDIVYPVPDREDWSMRRWGEEISQLIDEAEASRIVVLAHGGPTGLGAARDSIYGCDFRPEASDWGDPDLRMAIDRAAERRRPVVAVVAGHMHHALFGGGFRRTCAQEGPVLHLNAALVPRVRGEARALFVLRLEGRTASARLEWHHPDGRVDIEPLEPGGAPAEALPPT